jgi:serine phosphatase RsbU (regulator of sigma subunit)
MTQRDLLTLAAELLQAGSGGQVVEILAAVRQESEALYLIDDQAGVVYPVVGSGPEVPLTEIGHQAAWHKLTCENDHLGFWVSESSDAAAIAQLLAPLLFRLREREGLSSDLRRSKRELREIITAGQLLRHLDIEVLLVQALQTMLGSLDAEVGAILTPVSDLDDGVAAPDGQQLVVRTTWGIQPEHITQIRLLDGQLAVEMCFNEGCHLRLAEDEVEKLIDSAHLNIGLSSLLILPLVSPGHQHGVILLANPQQAFDAESQRLAETLSDMVIIALENARLVAATLAKERLARDMQLARTVQADMLPKEDLGHGSLVVAGRSIPCDETGGDYYSYRLNDLGKIQVFLGDVTGHGLGAALLTTIAHAIAQQGFRRNLPADSAIVQLNESLYATGSGRFMTGVVVTVDPETGAYSYCSAGHNPLLHITEEGQHWLPSQTLPLGIVEDLQSLGLDGVVDGVMSPGDWMVLYTDGFIEAPDAEGALWGEEAFAAVLKKARQDGKSPAVAIERVMNAVQAYSSEASIDDDLTIVIVARAYTAD